MNSKRSEIGDEKNTSFEMPDLEDLTPGFVPGKQKPGEQKRKVTFDGHHRFPRVSKEKDVPKASLANRVRKARKENR